MFPLMRKRLIQNGGDLICDALLPYILAETSRRLPTVPLSEHDESPLERMLQVSGNLALGQCCPLMTHGRSSALEVSWMCELRGSASVLRLNGLPYATRTCGNIVHSSSPWKYGGGTNFLASQLGGASNRRGCCGVLFCDSLC